MQENHKLNLISLSRRALVCLTLFLYLMVEVHVFPSAILAQNQTKFIVRDGSSMNNSPATSQLQEIVLPPELGSIEEFHQGTNGKTIIYIQDAHDSLEAQENIAKIIHHLVENYGIRTVFEEGYEGSVPSDEYFNFIKDPVMKERVSYFLLDKLRIGGAEYAHINRKQNFDLIGTDDTDLYLENIQRYRQSVQRREEIEEDLKKIERRLKKLINEYFSKEMKEWVKMKKRLDEDKLPLLTYLKRIASLRGKSADANEAVLNRYPTINLLLAAERSDDSKLAEQTQQIEVKALLKEIQELENDRAESYLGNDRNQTIFKSYEGIQLIKRLNRIEITSEEYEVIKDTIKDLKADELVKFIAKHSGESLALPKRWESGIRHAMEFYELAEARDDSIRKNMESYTERNAVLIFGGFHKGNIKSILKDNDYSYFIVSPKITKISEKHRQYYARLMAAGKNRLRSSFKLPKAARAASELFLSSQDQGYRMAFRSEVRALVNVFSRIQNEGVLTIDAMDLTWKLSDRSFAFHRSELRVDEVLAERSRSGVLVKETRDEELVGRLLDEIRELKATAAVKWKANEVAALLFKAYRGELDLLQALGIIPRPKEGSLIYLLGGADLYPFEIAQGVLIDNRPNEPESLVAAFARGAASVKVSVDDSAISENLKAVEGANFQDTERIQALFDEEAQEGNVVFFMKGIEHWFKYYAAQEFENRSDQAYTKLRILNRTKIDHANNLFTRTFKRFLQGPGKEATLVVYLTEGDRKTVDLLQDLGFEDVLPGLIPESARSKWDALALYDGLTGSMGVEHNLKHKSMAEIKGKLHVFRRTGGGRSELRRAATMRTVPLKTKAGQRQIQFDLSKDMDDMTIPSAVIIDTTSLKDLDQHVLNDELEELVMLLQHNRNFSVYLTGDEDRSDFVQALLKQSNVRRFQRPSDVRNKEILVQLNLPGASVSETEEVFAIKQAIRSGEQKQMIIPLHGQSGALTAFLKVLESARQEASEINEYEAHILNQIARFDAANGQWIVYEDVASAVRSELRAAYAVAISA